MWGRASLSLSVFFLVAVPVAAQQYEFIGESVTGSRYSIDWSSVRDQRDDLWNRQYRVAWFEVDHSNDRSVRHRRTLSFYRFSCAQHQYQAMQTIEYAATGRVIRTWSSPNYPSFEAAPPGTMVSRMLEVACS
jgi:hypothetical protein